MIDSFSSNYLEKVVEYLISEEYIISNYFDMTEMEEWWKRSTFTTKMI